MWWLFRRAIMRRRSAIRKLLGMPATIVMPNDAPQMKLDATRGYGAEVICRPLPTANRSARVGRAARHDTDSAVRSSARDCGARYRGTELIEDAGRSMSVGVCRRWRLIPAARSPQTALPQCRVIGVEPAAGNDVQQSLRGGEIVHIEVPKTIADGAQRRHRDASHFR